MGFWVLAALAVLAVEPSWPSLSRVSDAVSWTLAVGLFILLQAPFDVLGGYLLPVSYERRPPGPARWMRSWLQGVLVHGCTVVGLGVLGLVVGSRFGDGAAVLASVVAGLVLLFAQPYLLGVMGVRTTLPDRTTHQALNTSGLDPARVRVVHTDDSGFVGGWVGLPGRETLLLPSRWLSLPAAELHAVLVRRQLGLSTGSRRLGLFAALAFNTLGAVMVLLTLPAAGFESFSALLTFSAGFTLWAFLGILVLPTVSRGAVQALDRATVDKLGSPKALASAIETLDRLQEDEGHRPAWNETIFHPVPVRTARIEALDAFRPTGAQPWRITRLALFAGWAQFSWLSRAVHCNIGRPELWVVYPGD